MRIDRLVVGVGLTLSACESTPQPVMSSTLPASAEVASAPAPVLKGHPKAQLAAVTELQLAVVHGRLTDVRDVASWLVANPMEDATGWRPHLDALDRAARELETATDVARAGSHLAELGMACSSCHAAAGARPQFAPDDAVVDDVRELEGQMRRYQWAAARLWEGVLGPDDDRWRDGAATLAATHLDVSLMMRDKPNADAVELYERVRAGAQRAVELTEPSERAVMYGELVHACASCHAMMRPLPRARDDLRNRETISRR